ncbi:type VI secretion system baseplate subunit TssG [Massilia horti]|uniref:Type VI secretion system baseplate subunit TssG n=1 Tax=Massilia horti TaxID=2562153 RepID=A0A4Y9T7J9_9BURK|nr:type VI secretion system baseplate subunit TssG [Massilia horti]TFW33582.1 type VI secretion system baseplate subunit TssG [Massilia horti]
MLTAQRKPAASLIRRLLDQPYRFEFAQAVRIVHAWLAKVLPNAPAETGQYLRFRNRPSFVFPPSEIDALVVEVDTSTETNPHDVVTAGQLRRISITPSFGGLLGVSGALPNHYTEKILEAQERSAVDGQLEFFDLLSQRAHALHYEAWEKGRVYESVDAQGEDELRQMQWALAGVGAQRGPRPYGALSGDIPVFYAGVLRHYSTSPQVLEDVLTEYFGVPFKVVPFIGEWIDLGPWDSAQIGRGFSLNGGSILGPRTYSKAERVRLRVGPLSIDEFERFLPRSEGAKAIALMVSMFRVQELTFEVQLVLRARDVVPAALLPKSRRGLGLGYSAILTTRVPQDRDHDGLRYELSIHYLETIDGRV